MLEIKNENELETISDEEIAEEDSLSTPRIVIDDDEDIEDENYEDVDVEIIKQQLDEIKEKYTRICADFTNYKRRHEHEASNIESYATINVLKSLLPLFDGLSAMNFDNTTKESLEEGLKAFRSQVNKIMLDLGVKEIESDGKPFDAEFHSAVSTSYDPNVDENIITKTYMQGYKYKNNVLRPSMVEVNLK